MGFLFIPITLAAVAAGATAAWVFSSYLSSETMELQNRSSETKESQNRSSETEESQNRLWETTQDLNCLHVDGNFGASPNYDIETKASLPGNEVRVDQHIIHGSKIHPTTYTQLDHIQSSKVKNSKRSSKRQCDKSNEDTEVCFSTMCSASHISEGEFALLEAHLASLMAGASQIGRKKVTPLPLTQYKRQKNKQLDDQNFQKLKRKRKLKADVTNQIPRHLIPNINLQETMKIMSYNIWSIKYYKRDKRMNAFSHLIEQHSPDVILLQEVTPEIYIYFQSCNWWGIYKCSVKGKQATKRCFCMMLSKLPAVKFFYKQFVSTKTCKGISVAKFTSKSNKMLAVATCHLKSPDGPCTNDIVRTSQAKEAIDLLKFTPNVVLGGDMNWDEVTDGPFPLTRGWRDAWSNLKPEEHGYTYDTESNAMLRNRRCIV